MVEPFSFPKSLHRGQRYNVMCTVTRGDLPVSIRWFKDGQLIGPGAPSANQLDSGQQQQPAARLASQQFSVASERQQENQLIQQQQQLDGSAGLAIKQLDPYSSTLTFASLQSHHRGLYSCEAANEVGRANQSSSLAIHGECLGPLPGEQIRLAPRPDD